VVPIRNDAMLAQYVRRSESRACAGEAVRQDNICEYAIAYDDDLVRGKVEEGRKQQ